MVISTRCGTSRIQIESEGTMMSKTPKSRRNILGLSLSLILSGYVLWWHLQVPEADDASYFTVLGVVVSVAILVFAFIWSRCPDLFLEVVLLLFLPVMGVISYFDQYSPGYGWVTPVDGGLVDLLMGLAVPTVLPMLTVMLGRWTYDLYAKVRRQSQASTQS